MTIKLASWNVNGVRAILAKGCLQDFIASYQPDILCLQETKALKEQVNWEIPDYQQYWHSAVKRGYSGTAIFTKYAPLQVTYGLGIAAHDQEGRVITLEFAKCFLVTVYTPNAKTELERLDYRTKSWDVDFLNYVLELEKIKPVIFCGDLNVAHKEIDLFHPKTNTGSPGFTPEERASFDRIIANGFIDTFRYFNHAPHQYTWWSYRAKAREKNVGWRIDYFCVSQALAPKLVAAAIAPTFRGSDHCPVTLEVDGSLLHEPA